jgi:hypothetical protein
VAELKSHANHFFLCFSQNSYGMAVFFGGSMQAQITAKNNGSMARKLSGKWG